MRYLLDTNAVIAILNRAEGKAFANILKHRSEDVATSSIVMHELFYGAYKSARQARNLSVLEALQLSILDFDGDDAREAGRVRAHLTQRGRPIGPYDVLIAGQALRHRMILVTANVREFSRVPGLACENWSR
jgi:tRNA(fMet)-specific endonuclease VapC